MAPTNQNGVKHGMRSRAVLLPGEDVQAFRAIRHDLFATYHPRTPDEAWCVELMARHQWRMDRCCQRQARYEDKLDSLPGGSRAAQAAGQEHCEGDPHRWMHKSMDCELLEGRLDRRMIRTRDKLFALQYMRRNHLIPGAIDTTADWREFERRGDPLPNAPSPDTAELASKPANDAAPAEQMVARASLPGSSGKRVAQASLPGRPPLTASAITAALQTLSPSRNGANGKNYTRAERRALARMKRAAGQG